MSLPIGGALDQVNREHVAAVDRKHKLKGIRPFALLCRIWQYNTTSPINRLRCTRSRDGGQIVYVGHPKETMEHASEYVDASTFALIVQ